MPTKKKKSTKKVAKKNLSAISDQVANEFLGKSEAKILIESTHRGTLVTAAGKTPEHVTLAIAEALHHPGFRKAAFKAFEAYLSVHKH